jgi:hypothetical protein
VTSAYLVVLAEDGAEDNARDALETANPFLPLGVLSTAYILHCGEPHVASAPRYDQNQYDMGNMAHLSKWDIVQCHERKY